MGRNEQYDFYKAVLIFGVVWGHAITGFGGGSASCNITWLLRLYDMPFFMLISGYFCSLSMKKYSLGELLLNKTTTILLPAVCWSIVYLRRFIVYYAGYYFLFAVFFSSVIVILIEKVFTRDNLKWLKWTCYFLIITALYMTDTRAFNLCYLFPFFLLGFYNDSWYKYRLLWFIAFIIGLCFWNDSYNIWNADTNVLHSYKVILVNIYRLLLGCASVATFRWLFDMAYMYFKTVQPSSVSLISKTIGQETLALYLSHVFIIYVLKYSIRILETKLGYNPLLGNERLLVYFITPIFTIITLIVCYKMIAWSKRNKYFKNLWGFKIRLSRSS